MKGCIVLLLAVGVTAFGQTNEIETYRTGLFNSTNYWGGDVEAFREQVRANLVPLRTAGCFTPTSSNAPVSMRKTVRRFAGR